MANDDKNDTTAPRKAASNTPNRATGQQNDTGSLRDQVTAAHDARVTVPGADGVDARLDNRTGADRPPLESWPAKPQQIDGPDVMHQAEHTRRTLRNREQATGGHKGMFSPGPHGLGDESLREGGPAGAEQTLYGTEGLTEAELAKGNTKAAS